MVAVPSTMQALGNPMPPFELPDTLVADRVISSDNFLGSPVLVMFICNHCPYVIHIAEEMVRVGNEAQENGIAVVAISSNDVDNYPQDGPDKMSEFAASYGFEFPYLYDETQAVAQSFRAACTPDFYLFDRNHRLQYRGQLDGSRPANNAPVDGADLRNALSLVQAGESPSDEQIASIGCNIKWKKGNEPDYF